MSRTQRDIPRTIRTLLAHQGKNQSELAAYLGVGHSAISKAMNTPNRQWTVDELDKVADFFDVPLTLLLDDPDTLVRNSCFRPRLVAV